MIIWFIFSLFSLLLFLFAENNNKHQQKIIFIVYGIILTLFSTLRFDVGYDYPSYWDCQVPIEDNLFDALFSEYSYGSNYFLYGKQELIPKIFYLLTEHIGWRPFLFILYGTLTYLLIFYGIYKNTSCHFIALSVYLSLFYLSSLGLIRQALSVALGFYAINYIKNKQLLIFLVIVCIAFLIHKSAIILLIFYPIYHYLSAKSCFVAIVILFVYKAFFLNLFSILGYESYIFSEKTFSGGNIFKYIFLILGFVIIYFNQHFTKIKREENINLIKILAIGISIQYMISSQLSFRLSEYFNIVLIILFSNTAAAFWKKKRNFVCLFHFICITFFLFYIYWSSLNENKSPFTPYRFVLMTNTEVFK